MLGHGQGHKVEFQIVRDGEVQCDASVPLGATIEEGIINGLVRDEQNAGYRWLGAYLTFSSKPWEPELFTTVVQPKASNPPPMKAIVCAFLLRGLLMRRGSSLQYLSVIPRR